MDVWRFSLTVQNIVDEIESILLCMRCGCEELSRNTI
jgi:hypothetical protein